MMIEQFGPQVARVWNDLRTTTRNLVERAWQSSSSGTSLSVPRSSRYDPRADQELSDLLAALDERASQTEPTTEADGSQKAQKLADACANLLAQQTQSAEVFTRLIERAHRRNDYRQIDSLAELLLERLAPSELCELGRANNVVARALAQEALTQLPTPVLAALLRDPVDSVIARQALERQATEFASAEAQQVLIETEDF